VGQAAPGAAFGRSDDDGFVCVALHRSARFGPVGLGELELSARGCALAPDPLPMEGGP
jgi:hypothetical protein